MRAREYDAMRALEDVHWWYRSLRELVLRRLGDADRILDVGCGTGGMLDRLRGRRAFGVDLSNRALAHARGRGLANVAAASACALPFPSDAFDAVLALDVIYHRCISDDAAAVAECARVLRPGGDLLIHAAAYRRLRGAHDRAVHGARRYTTAGVRRLVEAAGLTVRELTYRNLPALPFAILLRLARRDAGDAGRREGRSDLHPLPSILDAALCLLSRAENGFVSLAPLPAGLSVWCVARKGA